MTNDRNTVNKAWKDVTKLGTVNKDKYGYNENVLVSDVEDQVSSPLL